MTRLLGVVVDGTGDDRDGEMEKVERLNKLANTARWSFEEAMDAGKMGRTMAEFTRQNEQTKFKENMLNDALADAFDESNVEEETDNVPSQVLDKLGAKLDSIMLGLDASSNGPPAKGGKVATTEEEEALMDALPDLRARLDAL